MERGARSFKRVAAPGKTGPKPKRITEQFLRQLEALSRMGATDKECAQFFEVPLSTLEYWIRNYRQVYDARKRGGMDADLQVVDSLFRRANGYHYQEEELHHVGRKLKRFKVNKYQHPEMRAIMFWLSNRHPEKWSAALQAKVQHRHSGSVSHVHHALEELDLDALSEQAQEVLYEIANAQLTNGTRDN